MFRRRGMGTLQCAGGERGILMRVAEVSPTLGGNVFTHLFQGVSTNITRGVRNNGVMVWTGASPLERNTYVRV